MGDVDRYEVDLDEVFLAWFRTHDKVLPQDLALLLDEQESTRWIESVLRRQLVRQSATGELVLTSAGKALRDREPKPIVVRLPPVDDKG
jgi:hypothetical protein